MDQVIQLLVETLVIIASFFNKENDMYPDSATNTVPSESEIIALSVACGGLVEILERSRSNLSIPTSTSSSSAISNINSSSNTINATSTTPLLDLDGVSRTLWSALVDLSKIKECAQELLNTSLLKLLSSCLESSYVSTTVAQGMDRMHSRNSLDPRINLDSQFITSTSLNVLINISTHFSELLSESFLLEGCVPLLFGLLQRYLEDIDAEESSQSDKKGDSRCIVVEIVVWCW